MAMHFYRGRGNFHPSSWEHAHWTLSKRWSSRIQSKIQGLHVLRFIMYKWKALGVLPFLSCLSCGADRTVLIMECGIFIKKINDFQNVRFAMKNFKTLSPSAQPLRTESGDSPFLPSRLHNPDLRHETSKSSTISHIWSFLKLPDWSHPYSKRMTNFAEELNRNLQDFYWNSPEGANSVKSNLYH